MRLYHHCDQWMSNEQILSPSATIFKRNESLWSELALFTRFVDQFSGLEAGRPAIVAGQLACLSQ